MIVRVNKKSQAGIVLAIVVLLILLSLLGLLLERKPVKEHAFEYEDDYAYSLLTSLLRSTTNSSDIKCRTTKDVAYKLSMPILKDSYCCGIYNMHCKDFIITTLNEKLDKINKTFKKSYSFYFEVGIKQKNNQEEIKYWYGNKTLKTCMGDKVSAVQSLEGETQSAFVYAKLLIKRRGEKCLR